MKEYICVNASFDRETLAFYAQFKVSTPVEDKMYNFREVRRHSNGQVGVLLEEIKNPNVPYTHPILGVTEGEPTFNINRFRTLSGDVLNAEELLKEPTRQGRLIK